MKLNFYKYKSLITSSFISAFIIYIIYIASVGMFIVRDEVKEFDLATKNIEKHRAHVLLMSKILEARINNKERLAESNEELVKSFHDYVYSVNNKQVLSDFDREARSVMHMVANYLSGTVDNEETYIMYRSYNSNLYILEELVKKYDPKQDIFTKEYCLKTLTCTKFAWKEQLHDRIIITPPYTDAITGLEVISIVSPVYFNDEIIGDFMMSVSLANDFVNQRELRTRIDGRYKYVDVTYGDYPFPSISFTKTYIGDNKTIFVYDYPVSALFIRHSYFFVLSFFFTLVLFYNRRLAVSRKRELDSAVSSAVVDELTGVYNRKIYRKASFDKIVNDNDCAVIAIDGNRIKRINDEFGHHIGDSAIKVIGRAMQRTFRKSDYLVRTGGDEFVAILPNCSTERATQLCEELQATLSRSEMPISSIKVTVSYGVAMKYKSMTLKDAIMKADEHLYQHKHQTKE